MLQTWLREDRFYNVQLQTNLFGGTSVFCSWGSRYGKRGGYKIIFCDSELEVSSALQVIKKRRRARGYKLMVWTPMIRKDKLINGFMKISSSMNQFLNL